MCTIGVRLQRECCQVSLGHRELVFIREWFDANRRTDHGSRRLDHVQQSDLATKLFGESQRILNCFLRCLGEIGGDQNFFQMKDLRYQFDGLRGFYALNCGFHSPTFSCRTKTRSAAFAESCAFFVMPDLTVVPAMLGEEQSAAKRLVRAPTKINLPGDK